MAKQAVPGWVGCIVGAVIAGTAATVGYAPELTYLMDVHPGVAGWVQAVGSIAAIGASAWIAIAVDQKASRRLRRDRDLEIFNITRAAGDVIAEIISVFDAARVAPDRGTRLGKERFSTTQKVVDRFPHERLTDPRVRQALWKAENALVFFEPRYDRFVAEADPNSEVAKDALEKMEGCSNSARGALDRVVACLEEYRRHIDNA